MYCSLISTFVVRCLDNKTHLVSISEISRLYLAFVAEQVGLSLIWVQSPEDRFSRDETHLMRAAHLAKPIFPEAGIDHAGKFREFNTEVQFQNFIHLANLPTKLQLLGPPGFNCWFSFAPVSSCVVRHPRDLQVSVSTRCVCGLLIFVSS